VDIKQLRNFLRIVELKSFSEASKHVRIAQPALGLQVRKLEDELGVKLLIRHARGVTPTEAGMLLYEHADIILRQVERAKNEVVDVADTPRGNIAFGLTPTVSLVMGAALVEKYHALCPNVSLRVVDGLSEVLVEWVSSGRLDLAFTYNPSGAAGLELEPLLVESLYLVGPVDAPQLAGDTIPLSSLKNVPLILPSNPQVLRMLVDEGAANADVDLNIYLEIDSVQTMKELVERSVAYTVLPFGAIEAEVADGRFAASRIVEPEINRTLSIVYSGRRPPSKAFTILHELIRDIAETLIKRGVASWRAVEAGRPVETERPVEAGRPVESDMPTAKLASPPPRDAA
jgi:LysR family nitrogen assimilation transcriptional regulator